MTDVEGTGGIRSCFSEIIKADKSSDYNKALAACARILKKHPKEAKYVYKCKLVALIKLEQYENALAFMKKTSPNEMGPAFFEKAYVLYRMNQNEEALAELENCDSNDPRAMELKAQIFYRIDRPEEAHTLLVQLLSKHALDMEDERKANLIAVEAQLAAKKKTKEGSVVTSPETHDQMYNACCADIEKGDFNAGLSKINKALELCRSNLEEDGFTPQEIEEEAAVLRLQRSFILHRLGRTDQAKEGYKEVEALKSTDASLNASLLNNLACLGDVSDGKKKLKAAMQIDQAKLSKRQRATLLLNHAIVLLLSNQLQPSKRALEQMFKEYGTSDDWQLAEAAWHWKNGEADKALSSLSHPDLSSVLARLHIHVNTGQLNEALSVLESLSAETRGKMAVVSLVAALLHATSQSAKAINFLKGAVEKCANNDTKGSLLDKLASLESREGREAEAAAHLEQLSKLRPSDMGVTCRLIRAYSHCQPSKADSLREAAFPGGSKTSLDADRLEESDWILYGEKYKQRKEAKGDVQAQDTEIVTGKLRKRKRKRTGLPKNMDPSVPPDPERWLPKQERTAYKKKRKNREREVGRGTQGASAPAVEYKGADPTSSPRPGPVPAEGPRQQRPAQQKKKKAKGGGGKW